jgi:hypothetical protein
MRGGYRFDCRVTNERKDYTGTGGRANRRRNNNRPSYAKESWRGSEIAPLGMDYATIRHFYGSKSGDGAAVSTHSSIDRDERSVDSANDSISGVNMLRFDIGQSTRA